MRHYAEFTRMSILHYAGMRFWAYATMLISLERVCVKKVKQPDGGDIAEFGKKRNTDYDFPPPLYVGEKL